MSGLELEKGSQWLLAKRFLESNGRKGPFPRQLRNLMEVK